MSEVVEIHDLLGCQREAREVSSAFETRKGKTKLTEIAVLRTSEVLHVRAEFITE